MGNLSKQKMLNDILLEIQLLNNYWAMHLKPVNNNSTLLYKTQKKHTNHGQKHLF